MDPGFGVRIPLDADSFSGSFAGACVGGGSLAADGQAAQVTYAAVAFDGLEAFEVESDFAAEITFGDVFSFLDGVNDLGELLFVQIFGTDGGIDGRAFEDDPGVGRADSIDIAQGDIDAFVAGDIDTE
jgi:hypothetical protein